MRLLTKKRNANEGVNESGNFRAEAQEGAARGEQAAYPHFFGVGHNNFGKSRELQ